VAREGAYRTCGNGMRTAAAALATTAVSWPIVARESVVFAGQQAGGGCFLMTRRHGCRTPTQDQVEPPQND